MTKKVIVALKNVDAAHNQFKELPPEFTRKGTHFLIHNDPQYIRTGNRIATNYDMCITSLIKGSTGDKWQHMPKSIVLEREDKYRVMNRIWQASISAETKHMVNPMVYGPFQLGDYTFHDIFPKVRYVTKPIYGARGLGIYLIDATKHGLKNLLIPLAEYLDDFKEGQKLPKKLIPYVQEINRDEVSDNEFERTMKDDDGFIIEEYIENVVAEYRVIAYCGKIWFIGKRQRNEQGKAHDEDLITQEHVNKWHPNAIPRDFYPIDRIGMDPIMKEFEEVLKYLPQDIISIDFYITKEGNWGIFEYCTQFGTRFVPAAVLMPLYEEYVYDQWQKIKESEK